ncbi:uncharacterized protein LOC128392885 isoform X3 [Panonychus citri]|uniref:uncharacterized protein LOC128392885 isoform X3 n=1 Tax=Panonychus citri TaxID=50023 RepID=UPI002307AD04|nr:uncharacterized protein LOC128392885 isoform X3 [Panonychus citri]
MNKHPSLTSNGLTIGDSHGSQSIDKLAKNCSVSKSVSKGLDSCNNNAGKNLDPSELMSLPKTVSCNQSTLNNLNDDLVKGKTGDSGGKLITPPCDTNRRPSVYFCLFCDKTYSKFNLALLHIRAHIKFGYHCKYGDNHFDLYPSYMAHHVREEHPNEPVEFEDDFKERKNIHSWIIDFLNEQFTASKLTDEDAVVQSPNSWVHCSICVKAAKYKKKKPVKFYSIRTLERHFWQHTRWWKVDCNICGASMQRAHQIDHLVEHEIFMDDSNPNPIKLFEIHFKERIDTIIARKLELIAEKQEKEFYDRFATHRGCKLTLNLKLTPCDSDLNFLKKKKVLPIKASKPVEENPNSLKADNKLIKADKPKSTAPPPPPPPPPRAKSRAEEIHDELEAEEAIRLAIKILTGGGESPQSDNSSIENEPPTAQCQQNKTKPDAKNDEKSVSPKTQTSKNVDNLQISDNQVSDGRDNGKESNSLRKDQQLTDISSNVQNTSPEITTKITENLNVDSSSASGILPDGQFKIPTLIDTNVDRLISDDHQTVDMQIDPTPLSSPMASTCSSSSLLNPSPLFPSLKTPSTSIAGPPPKKNKIFCTEKVQNVISELLARKIELAQMNSISGGDSGNNDFINNKEIDNSSMLVNPNMILQSSVPLVSSQVPNQSRPIFSMSFPPPPSTPMETSSLQMSAPNLMSALQNAPQINHNNNNNNNFSSTPTAIQPNLDEDDDDDICILEAHIANETQQIVRPIPQPPQPPPPQPPSQVKSFYIDVELFKQIVGPIDNTMVEKSQNGNVNLRIPMEKLSQMVKIVEERKQKSLNASSSSVLPTNNNRNFQINYLPGSHAPINIPSANLIPTVTIEQVQKPLSTVTYSKAPIMQNSAPNTLIQPPVTTQYPQCASVPSFGSNYVSSNSSNWPQQVNNPSLPAVNNFPNQVPIVRKIAFNSQILQNQQDSTPRAQYIMPTDPGHTFWKPDPTKIFTKDPHHQNHPHNTVNPHL